MSDCSSDFTDFQIYFSLACGILSLIGGTLVIFFTVKHSLFERYSFKILLYLSINDIIRGIVTIFLFSNRIPCGIISYLSDASYISNMLWSLSLINAIYRIVVVEDYNLEKYNKVWFLCCFFVVYLAEATPFITHSYVYTEYMCQIELNSIGNYYRLFLFYIPGSIILLLTLYFAIKIYKKLKTLNIQRIKHIVFNRGLIYGMTMAIICIPLFIIRSFEIFIINCSTVYIGVICYDMCILHGFVNSIIFFSSKDIQKLISQNEANRHEVMSSLIISFHSTIN